MLLRDNYFPRNDKRVRTLCHIPHMLQTLTSRWGKPRNDRSMLLWTSTKPYALSRLPGPLDWRRISTTLMLIPRVCPRACGRCKLNTHARHPRSLHVRDRRKRSHRLGLLLRHVIGPTLYRRFNGRVTKRLAHRLRWRLVVGAWIWGCKGLHWRRWCGRGTDGHGSQGRHVDLARQFVSQVIVVGNWTRLTPQDCERLSASHSPSALPGSGIVPRSG